MAEIEQIVKAIQDFEPHVYEACKKHGLEIERPVFRITLQDYKEMAKHSGPGKTFDSVQSLLITHIQGEILSACFGALKGTDWYERVEIMSTEDFWNMQNRMGNAAKANAAKIFTDIDWDRIKPRVKYVCPDYPEYVGEGIL
jgi:hypothetical protein